MRDQNGVDSVLWWIEPKPILYKDTKTWALGAHSYNKEIWILKHEDMVVSCNSTHLDTQFLQREQKLTANEKNIAYLVVLEYNTGLIKHAAICWHVRTYLS